LTVGGIGIFTLGMMTRVSLGHTGRPIVIGKMILFAFIAMTIAFLIRVPGMLFFPGQYREIMHWSAGFWDVAIVLFLVVFIPILIKPRADGRPG
jgi:uncharacterized protein involved in response to NO